MIRAVQFWWLYHWCRVHAELLFLETHVHAGHSRTADSSGRNVHASPVYFSVQTASSKAQTIWLENRSALFIIPLTLGESSPAALAVLENSQHCENGRAKPEPILQPSAWLAACGTGEGWRVSLSHFHTVCMKCCLCPSQQPPVRKLQLTAALRCVLLKVWLFILFYMASGSLIICSICW